MRRVDPSRAFPVFALFAFLLAGCSLASEPIPAGPIETGPLPGEEAAATVPLTLPRVASGQLTYVARCASCHGATGAGDGEFAAQLAQQGAALPDFTDPALARSRSPQEWYTTITLGTVSSGGLMPPWADSLTDSERWDVTYYLYTLSTPENVLARGEALYAESCAECHAADGSLEGLNDIAAMAVVSPASIAQRLASGEDGVHDFGEFSEDDLNAVVAYARTFSYDAALGAAVEAPPAAETPAAEATPGVQETEVAEALPGTTRIEGVVTTADGTPVPAGSEVSLTGISVDAAGGFNEFLQRTATTAGDGSFRFDDLPTDQPNAAYIVSVTYGGVEFANGAVIDPALPVIALPITVYEVTSDPGVITVDQAHIILREHPDALLVMEVYIFSNTSDRVYLSDQVVRSGQRGGVAISVPPDATSITFEEGQLGGRFVEFGDRIYDTRQVYPGPQSHSVIVTYVLPMSGGSRELDIPFDYGASRVTVLVQGAGRVRSDRLNPAGTRELQGESFNQYVGQDFAPGETLTLRVQSASALGGLQGVAVPVGIGLAALLAVGGVATWLVRRRREAEEIDVAGFEGMAPQQEALLRQIADLDDDYEAGKVNRLDYEARRAELKAQLAESLQSNE